MNLIFLFLKYIKSEHVYCVKPLGSTVNCTGTYEKEISSFNDFVPTEYASFQIANDNNTIVDVSYEDFASFGSKFYAENQGFINFIFPLKKRAETNILFHFVNLEIHQKFTNFYNFSTCYFEKVELVNCTFAFPDLYHRMFVSDHIKADFFTINSLDNIYANHVTITDSFTTLNTPVSIHSISESGFLNCRLIIYNAQDLNIFHESNQIRFVRHHGILTLCKFSSINLESTFENSSVNLISNKFSDLANFSLTYYMTNSEGYIDNTYYDEIQKASISTYNSNLVLNSEYCPYNLELNGLSSISLPNNITKMRNLRSYFQLTLKPSFESSQIILTEFEPQGIVNSSQFLNISVKNFHISKDNIKITNSSVSVLDNLIVNLTSDAYVEELVLNQNAKINWNIIFDKNPKIFVENIKNTKNQVINIHNFDPSIYNNRTKFSSIIYQKIILFSSTKPAPQSFVLNYVDEDIPLSTIIQNINLFDGERHIYGLSINDYPTKFYPELYLDENSVDNPDNRNYLLSYVDARNHSYFTSNITRKLNIRSSNNMDYTFDVYNFSSKFDLYYGSKDTNKLVLKFNKDTNKYLNSLLASHGILKIIGEGEEDIKLSLENLSLNDLKEFSISEKPRIQFTNISCLYIGLDTLKYLKYDYVKDFHLQITGFQFSLRVFEDGFAITKLSMSETIFFYNKKMENFVIYITEHQQMTLSCDKSNPKPIKLCYQESGTDITVRLLGKYKEDFENNLMELPKGIIIKLTVESEYIPIDISDCSYASIDRVIGVNYTTIRSARFSKSTKISVLDSKVTLMMKKMILCNESKFEFISTMRGSKSQFIVEELNVEESSSVSVSSCMVSSTINIKKNSSISFLNSNISGPIMNVELDTENHDCIIDIKTTTDIVEPPQQINIKIIVPKIIEKRTVKWTQEFVNNVLSDKWTEVINVTDDGGNKDYKLYYSVTKLSGKISIEFTLTKKIPVYLIISVICSFVGIILIIIVIIVIVKKNKRKDEDTKSSIHQSLINMTETKSDDF